MRSGLKTMVLAMGFVSWISFLFPVDARSEGIVEDQTQLGLLLNGPEALSTRLQALKNAKKSIHLQVLTYEGGDTAHRFAEILKEKKKEGLDVRLIVDSIAQLFQPAIMKASAPIFHDLMLNGVEVLGYEPKLIFTLLNEMDVLNNRYHEKLFVIDGGEPDGIAIVGGRNIGDSYFDIERADATLLADQDVVLKGGIVLEVENAFLENWKYLEHRQSHRANRLSRRHYWERERKRFLEGKIKVRNAYIPTETGSARIREAEEITTTRVFRPVKARFYMNRPWRGENNIQKIFLNLIREARDEILIVMDYYLPDDQIKQELIFASQRGVKIRILTNHRLDRHDIVSWMATDVARYHYWDVLRDGASIGIYETHGFLYGRPYSLHSKVMIVDGKTAVVGASNMDYRSFSLNSESILVFEGEQSVEELRVYNMMNGFDRARRVTEDEAQSYRRCSSLKECFLLRLKLKLWKYF